MCLWWSFCVSKCWSFEVEFTYLVLFTRMPGESYRWRLRSLLLCLCDVFRAAINPLWVDSETATVSIITYGADRALCAGRSLCCSDSTHVLFSKSSGRINHQFLQSETEQGPERSCRINTQNKKYRRRLRSLLLCLCFHYF